jgi:sulfide:quinone oxidoreductase
VIAGGGVAALEGLLALRTLAGAAVDIELLAPEREFVYAATSVAEPFGLSERRSYDLEEIANDQGAHLVSDTLESVDPERRVIGTAASGEVEYGALLLAIGARRTQALPGALTFRGSADVAGFRALLSRLEAGSIQRVAFVAPPAVRWPLAIYELALLTATHLQARRVRGVELRLITHEPAPLHLFGRRASESVARLLGDAGAILSTGCEAEAVDDGRLHLRDGRTVPVDAAVALPQLSVPALPGIPQGPQGFIPTTDYGAVETLFRVYAAGDATWFPIKQGGVGAQQADAAATAIAACAGVDVTLTRVRPVLRGVLLTGTAPHYLRAAVGERDDTSAAGPDALWWPPAKIAGRYLAPYLARQAEPRSPLEDLEAVSAEPGRRGAEHTAALELALNAADADARWGDRAGALRWLGVAEQLNLVLPPEYAEKRGRWAR